MRGKRKKPFWRAALAMTVLCAAVMLCATAAFAADETYVVKLSGDYVSLFSDADGDDDGLLSLGNRKEP